MAAARRWWRPTTASARGAACRSTTRSIPTTHHPVPPEPRFAADLAFLGNRLPDREARVEEFFLDAAALLPERRFLLGGNGWDDKAMPPNVRALGHVDTARAQRLQLLAARGAERRARQHGGDRLLARHPRLRGGRRRRLPDHRRLGRARAVPRAGRGGAGRARRARRRRASRGARRPNARGAIGAGGARRASWPSTPTRSAARRSMRCCARTHGARAARHERAPHDARRPRASASPRPGATAMRRPIARCCGRFAARGHDVLFLERDVPWYAAHRDLPTPTSAGSHSIAISTTSQRWRGEIAAADAVIVGSYVPEGVAVGAAGAAHGARRDRLLRHRHAGHAGEAGARRRRISLAATDPGLRPLSLLHRRPDAGAAGAANTARPRARALYCSVDPTAYPAAATRRARWDLGYLGTYSADRQPALERLLLEPARRRRTCASSSPGRNIPTRSPGRDNVERHRACAARRASGLLRRQRFTLNVTRADMMRGRLRPSVRLFEAAACGTPIISDRWDGSTTLFRPGEEIVLAESAEEVLAHCSTGRSAAPRDRGAAARARVLAEHTAAHRAAELERYLRERRHRATDQAASGLTKRERGDMAQEGRQQVAGAGGAGFLGSHLCDALLARWHEVICVDSFLTGRRREPAAPRRSPRFELIEADIMRAAAGRGSAPRAIDAVFNLACAASPPHYQADPEHTLLTSVLGTRNLLRPGRAPAARASCRPRPARSMATRRSIRRPRPIGATSTPPARAPATTRASAPPRRWASTIAACRRADVRVARIFNTYGPRMRADDGRMVSNVVTQALAGEPHHLYGDGSQTRSFCYVGRPGRRAGAPVRVDTPVQRDQPRQPGGVARRGSGGAVVAMTGSRSRGRASAAAGGRPAAAEAGYCAGTPTARLGALRSAGGRAAQHHRLVRRRPSAGPPRYARRRTTPIRATRTAPACCRGRSRCRSAPKAISRPRPGGRSAAPRLVGPGQVDGGVDQRDVARRPAGSCPASRPAARVVLLGQQADVVAQREQALEQPRAPRRAGRAGRRCRPARSCRRGMPPRRAAGRRRRVRCRSAGRSRRAPARARSPRPCRARAGPSAAGSRPAGSSAGWRPAASPP